MKQEPWYERNPDRLRDEKTVMADRFPDAELRLIEDDYLAWFASLTTNNGNTYNAMILYPNNFPSRAPECFILKPDIEPSETKHMYSDGSLCLFTQNSRSWEEKSTAATATAWVACWLLAYEEWLETGNWPGDEH